MARIELKNAPLYIRDGLAGTADINDTPAGSDVDFTIDNVSLNTTVTGLVPIGATFTISTEAGTPVHTVTDRTVSLGVNEVKSLAASGASSGTFTITITLATDTSTPVTTAGIAFDAVPATIETAIDTAMSLAGITGFTAGDISVSGAGTADLNPTVFTFDGTYVDALNHPVATVDGAGLTGGGSEAFTVTTQGEVAGDTDNITFVPAIIGTLSDDDVITFAPQLLYIQLGDGNLTFTETVERIYDRDRGLLDTVRNGDEQPLELNLEFTYVFVTQQTDKVVTPVDALKQLGDASEWVSSDSDQCAPYAVNIELRHCLPCGTDEDEKVVFTDFRYETLEYDLQEASIAVSGRCNVTDAVATRLASLDCPVTNPIA